MTANARHGATTSGRPIARARQWALLLCALVALVLGGAVPASAHAALLSTTPGEGSVVATAPSRITLGFSEGVLLSADSLIVYDPNGKQVQRGTARHTSGRPDSATVGLRGGLPKGTYTVAWKAVSADTHPVGGAWTFSIGAPSQTSAVPVQRQAGGGPVGVLYDMGRYAAYVGYALLAGSVAFLLVCWPGGTRLREMRQLAVGGWTTLTAATIALLLLRGPFANGTGLGTVLDLGGLRSVAGTKSGVALLSRLLLLAAAAVFLSVVFGGFAAREDPRERRRLATVLKVCGTVIAVGTAATWSLVEHASVGIQPGVAMPVDIAHLLAMAGWTGGLAALLTALYHPTGIGPEAVRRFSRIAFGCVCVLVATGVYQSWRQVGSWHALGSTVYGTYLLIKIGLVACMLGTAWFSRRWTGRLADRAPGQPREPGQPEDPERQTPERPEEPAEERAPGQAEEQPAEPHAARQPGGEPQERPQEEPATAAAAPVVTAQDPVRAAQLARQRAAAAGATARKQRDADPARAGLRRSVLAEAAVAVIVLGVTTVLSASEPGRAVEETVTASAGPAPVPPQSTGQVFATLPYDTGGPRGNGTADIHLDPGRTGANELHLVVSDPVGNPVDVPEVDLAFTLKARGIGPLPVKLRHTGPGSWAATGLQLPMAGEWQLALTVRTSAIDEVTVTKNVAIN